MLLSSLPLASLIWSAFQSGGSYRDNQENFSRQEGVFSDPRCYFLLKGSHVCGALQRRRNSERVGVPQAGEVRRAHMVWCAGGRGSGRPRGERAGLRNSARALELPLFSVSPAQSFGPMDAALKTVVLPSMSAEKRESLPKRLARGFVLKCTCPAALIYRFCVVPVCDTNVLTTTSAVSRRSRDQQFCGVPNVNSRLAALAFILLFAENTTFLDLLFR